MNTPEEVLKAQRALSTWSGTKAAAGYLMIVGLVLCAGSAILVLATHDKSLGAFTPPLMIVTMCALLRTEATKKVRAIEAQLAT